MKQKLMKSLICMALTLVVIMPMLALEVKAQAGNLDLGTSYPSNIGLSNSDPRDVAVSVIKVLLGFLGIIAVIIILLGGFKWMTAAGNEDKVAEAKKIIVAGIIGLIIILAAWAIANFVITNIMNAMNTS
jgi:hypothetical protein